MITIHTDGASRGNPGAAAIAYVIEGLPERIEQARTIGTTTNNQAEYQALLAALTKLADMGPTSQDIECIADSELMIKQLRGEYRVKDELLRPHYQAILTLVRQLEVDGNTFSFTAVRRAQNKRADQLANLALDGQL